MAVKLMDPALGNNEERTGQVCLREVIVRTIKTFFLCSLLLLLPLCLHAAIARAEPETPFALVSEFYAWFFSVDSQDSPAIDDDAILRYVDAQTVNMLRSSGSDFSYFTKADGYTDEWSAVQVIVSDPIILKKILCIVPVTFQLPSGNRRVDVLVSSDKDVVRIVEVVDKYIWR
jgi:hypothetical protein